MLAVVCSPFQLFAKVAVARRCSPLPGVAAALQPFCWHRSNVASKRAGIAGVAVLSLAFQWCASLCRCCSPLEASQPFSWHWCAVLATVCSPFAGVVATLAFHWCCSGVRSFCWHCSGVQHVDVAAGWCCSGVHPFCWHCSGTTSPS